MKVGTLFFRVIARKLQSNSSSTQFILLGGFSAPLTAKSAAYYETLSPAHVLQQQEIDNKVASMALHGNAADTRDITDGAAAKKLAKLFELGFDYAM